MNELLLRALHCQNTERPPVWLMRQAGRYMPEYRCLRAKHSFLEMCHQPNLVVEITKLPIKVFEMDAAILFSDILVVAEAFGVGLRFEDKVGPIIERPLRSIQDVDQLPRVDVKEKLNYVSQSIRALRTDLKVPLIGFCGAPFTVASYMIEGGSSRDLKLTKQWMLREPVGFHRLLSRIAECTIAYLQMQIESGVQAIQIFDSWAHFLGHHQFREFSLTYLEKLLTGIRASKIPVVLYCRGSSVFAQQMGSINPAGISLDWQADITQIRQVIPSNIALQGNLDPDILYAPPNIIRQEVTRMLIGMQQDKGYIFNLGHGIHPDTSPDSVKTLVECVKSV